MTNQISRCKSCGAKVMWLKSPSTGKLAPIDAEPSPGGNIVVEDGFYLVLGKDERGATDLHMNHFVTCPQAKQWGSKR